MSYEDPAEWDETVESPTEDSEIEHPEDKLEVLASLNRGIQMPHLSLSEIL